MAPLRLASLLLLTLLLSAPAQADEGEPRWVRLTLVDGQVVEGRLEHFGDRRYRVRLDGRLKTYGEEQIKRLEVLGPGEEPPGAGSASGMLGSALRRALAQGDSSPVLGARWFLLRETEMSSDSPFGGGSRRARVHESVVRVEAEWVTERLLLTVDVVPRGDAAPRLLGLKSSRPSRVCWTFDSRGRVQAFEGVAWNQSARALRARGRLGFVDGLTWCGAAGWDLDADRVPLEALVFLLAPLWETAPDHVSPRLLLADGPAHEAAIARRLSGAASVGGVWARTVSIRWGDRQLTVAVAAQGERRGEVLRVDERSRAVHPLGAENPGELTALEPDRAQELLAEWGRERVEEPEDQAPPVAGEFAQVLAGALEDGTVERLLGERWLDWVSDDGVQVGVRLSGRHVGAHLELSLQLGPLGTGSMASLIYLFDSQGVLSSLRVDLDLYPLQGRAVCERAGDRLVVRSAVSDRYDSGQSVAAVEQAFDWPSDAAPDLLARLVLPLLPEQLPEPLQLTLIDELALAGVPGRRLTRGARVAMGEPPAGTEQGDGQGGAWVAFRLKLAPGSEAEFAWAGSLDADGGARWSVPATSARAWSGTISPTDRQTLSRAYDALTGPDAPEERPIAARHDRTRSAAAVALREVAAAQEAFRAEHGRPASSLAELSLTPGLPTPLDGGWASGYHVSLRSHGDRWLALAWPVVQLITGDTWLVTDGTVYTSSRSIDFTPDLSLPEGVSPYRWR